ncbi:MULTISPECIES: hypothetical protein [unclassified Micromonospora]|uniref:hypothetical protein n=1 Tax=unclassified Micromonospora TaxID=2617518 RepID=UPI003633B5F8
MRGTRCRHRTPTSEVATASRNASTPGGDRGGPSGGVAATQPAVLSGAGTA